MKIARFVSAWLLLFAACALLLFNFEPRLGWLTEIDGQLMFTAIAVSTLGALLFSSVSLKGRGTDPINPKIWAHVVANSLVFVGKMIVASIDVALRIIRPGPPLKPGIVRVPTQVKKEWGVTLLSNSITLTPGTMVVDVDERSGDLYVHWINVSARDPEERTKKVSGAYERILRRVS